MIFGAGLGIGAFGTEYTRGVTLMLGLGITLALEPILAIVVPGINNTASIIATINFFIVLTLLYGTIHIQADFFSFVIDVYFITYFTPAYAVIPIDDDLVIFLTFALFTQFF